MYRVFRAPILYSTHRAVIFAIAQFSCLSEYWYIQRIRGFGDYALALYKSTFLVTDLYLLCEYGMPEFATGARTLVGDCPHIAPT